MPDFQPNKKLQYSDVMALYEQPHHVMNDQSNPNSETESRVDPSFAYMSKKNRDMIRSLVNGNDALIKAIKTKDEMQKKVSEAYRDCIETVNEKVKDKDGKETGEEKEVKKLNQDKFNAKKKEIEESYAENSKVYEAEIEKPIPATKLWYVKVEKCPKLPQEIFDFFIEMGIIQE